MSSDGWHSILPDVRWGVTQFHKSLYKRLSIHFPRKYVHFPNQIQPFQKQVWFMFKENLCVIINHSLCKTRSKIWLRSLAYLYYTNILKVGTHLSKPFPKYAFKVLICCLLSIHQFLLQEFLWVRFETNLSSRSSIFKI